MWRDGDASGVFDASPPLFGRPTLYYIIKRSLTLPSCGISGGGSGKLTKTVMIFAAFHPLVGQNEKLTKNTKILRRLGDRMRRYPPLVTEDFRVVVPRSFKRVPGIWMVSIITSWGLAQIGVGPFGCAGGGNEWAGRAKQ